MPRHAWESDLDHLQVMKKNAVLRCKFDPSLHVDVGFPYFCIQSSLNPIQAWFFYVGFMFTTA